MDNYDSTQRGRTDFVRIQQAPAGNHIKERHERMHIYQDANARRRESSVEEIRRDFPPPVQVYEQRGRRVRYESGDNDYAGVKKDVRYEYRSRSRTTISSTTARLANSNTGRKSDSTSESDAPITTRRHSRRRESSRGRDLATLSTSAYVARQDRDARYDRGLAYPPPSHQQHRTTTAAGNLTKSKGTTHNTHSPNSSTSSLSTLLSSSEDERLTKKTRRKELLTAGLATVATAHLASGIYTLMDNRDKRNKQVETGEASREEVKKDRNFARLQDAAALTVIALGIKGTYGRWKNTRAMHKGYVEQKQLSAKRQEARARRVRSRAFGPNGELGLSRL
ncbi:hypothetical protein MMC24_006264 [Lignoscripta atroalba]|nr:hypothetical protein [Lignoscripta atroalba]